MLCPSGLISANAKAVHPDSSVTFSSFLHLIIHFLRLFFYVTLIVSNSSCVAQFANTTLCVTKLIDGLTPAAPAIH